MLRNGRGTGGIPFTQGPITYFLKNGLYIGEIVHKGQSYPGEHEAILDKDLFEAVQAKMAENLNRYHAKQASSNALLIGKLFDDTGNVMSPTHCRKNGIRYRYYTSRAFIDGRKQDAGTIPRVAADDVEDKIIEAIQGIDGAAGQPDASQDGTRALIQAAVLRVVIEKSQLVIALTNTAAATAGQPTLSIPWSPRSKKPKRDLILPAHGAVANPRPMHTERRAKHLRAVALGRKWLDELVSGKITDAEAIAARESRSVRSVNMTISLAFVAPDIIEAAVVGRLPRGIGVTRLTDLPPSWARQKETLGLPAKF